MREFVSDSSGVALPDNLVFKNLMLFNGLGIPAETAFMFCFNILFKNGLLPIEDLNKAFETNYREVEVKKVYKTPYGSEFSQEEVLKILFDSDCTAELETRMVSLTKLFIRKGLLTLEEVSTALGGTFVESNT